MIKYFFTIWMLFSATLAFSQEISVLRCEGKTEPAGIENVHPGLSWEIISTKRNMMQSSYRILVSQDTASLAKNIGSIWDSKRVFSATSLYIPYAGKTLQAGSTYYWKVMIWDTPGQASGWSKVSQWQMGLPEKKDWKGASWIAYEALPDSSLVIPAEHGKGTKPWANKRNVLPLLRKGFTVHKPVKKATAFICGLGQFEMSINGQKTGDHFLDPGWTKYDERSLYVTFDITSQLQQGRNVIGVMLGNGYYYSTRERYRKLTGAFGYPKMICRLQIEYSDGTTENVISGPDWKTAPGPITFSSIYGGEDYDAGLEQQRWNVPAFNDSAWKQVVLVKGPSTLQSQLADPLKIMHRFLPANTTLIKPGITVYDMGQNASGIPEITVQGKRGDSVRIIAGELLNADGTVTQKHTGSPSYFIYILKGEEKETWQPRFSYYGYRYLQVESVAEVKGLQSLHTRNAAASTGYFSCSADLFNRTYTLIDWAIRSNLTSILTDCPHRERLGWLEQMYLMGSSIHYGYDVHQLFRKALEDMRTAQTKDGLVPSTVPEYTEMHFANGFFRDSPEWGSAAIILPWYLYQWYGDKAVLMDNYNMMQRYIRYLESKSIGHTLSYGLGDWYDIGPERSGFSQLTPLGLTATATYYYDLEILQKIAALIGKEKDAALYGRLAKQVKAAFNKKFFLERANHYGAGSQTSNAMAVYMKLVEPAFKPAVMANIEKDIRNRNNGLTAGDIGFRYLLKVLAQEGLSHVIYDMNSRTDVPGYGFQLKQGATALTESWIASPQVSNNHLMLGHIMEWFYEGIGGISQAEGSIGYRQIVIRPEPVGELTSAKTGFHSPYGMITTEWTKTMQDFKLEVIIPANTTATIYLPVGANSIITESDVVIQPQKREKSKAVIPVGAGKYIFYVKN